MRRIISVLICLTLLSLTSACTVKQEGTLKGRVTPSGITTRISVDNNGRTVAQIDADITDGMFTTPLPVGTYTITISSSSTPLPLVFSGILIRHGETTMLPVVDISQSLSRSAVTGKVYPGNPETRITLIHEGKERAQTRPDEAGKYVFTELPAGDYLVRAQTPGYAAETAPVNVAVEQKVEQNVRLLMISDIAGVDWANGKIRAVGKGLPPLHAANAVVNREMAKRAALVDAERNLLKIVQRVRINDKLDVETYMQIKGNLRRIQGYISGYTIVEERELEQGSFQVILELPLTGPTGLSRFILD